VKNATDAIHAKTCPDIGACVGIFYRAVIASDGKRYASCVFAEKQVHHNHELTKWCNEHKPSDHDWMLHQAQAECGKAPNEKKSSVILTWIDRFYTACNMKLLEQADLNDFIIKLYVWGTRNQGGLNIFGNRLIDPVTGDSHVVSCDGVLVGNTIISAVALARGICTYSS